MSNVKYKYIRYPNELEAMGFTANGNASQNGGGGVSSEQTMKDAIYDIFHFFKDDLSLTYIKTDGDLDLTNIPNLNVVSKISSVSDTQFYPNKYGFHIFAFNDELQETYPIFIKLEYCLTNIQIYANNNTSSYPRYAFSVIFSVINDVNKVLYSYNLMNTFSGTDFDYNNRPDIIQYYTKYTTLYSYGFYNKTNLYFNIYPKKVVASQNRTAINVNMGYLAPYISLYLSRTANYIKIIRFSNQFTGSYSSSQPTNFSQVTNYISYDGTQSYNSNNNAIIPFTDKIITNNTQPSFRTIDIDSKNKTYECTDLLTTYTSMIPGSGVSVNIDIDGKTYEYLTYKYIPSESPIYLYSTNISLLFNTGEVSG